MGLFWPQVDVYGQNDEVSTDVHTPVHAKVVADTPRSTQQAASVDRSSSAQRASNLLTFSTDWFWTVLQEIMTETGIWGRPCSEVGGRSILRSILGQFRGQF